MVVGRRDTAFDLDRFEWDTGQLCIMFVIDGWEGGWWPGMTAWNGGVMIYDLDASMEEADDL